MVGTWDTLAGLRIGCSGGHRGHFGLTQNWLQWWAQGTLWLDSELVAVVCTGDTLAGLVRCSGGHQNSGSQLNRF